MLSLLHYQLKRAATKQMPPFDYTEEAESSVVTNSEIHKYVAPFTEEQKNAMRNVMDQSDRISSHQYEMLGKETGLTKQQMMSWIRRKRRAMKNLTNALEVLEECFQKNHQLDTLTLRYLIDDVRLTFTQVQQWFKERNEILNEQQRLESLRTAQKPVAISPNESKINEAGQRLESLKVSEKSVAISPDGSEINKEEGCIKSLVISQKTVAISPDESKIDSSGFATCDAELLKKAKVANFYGMYNLKDSPFYDPRIFWNYYKP